ncbi:unnamed protein product [Somion occarium]|uniref:Uncharacterized protein n=1 Tax=Somion occarium TaxID=3059160 RepID=A0ABP1CVP1_9APHY
MSLDQRTHANYPYSSYPSSSDSTSLSLTAHWHHRSTPQGIASSAPLHFQNGAGGGHGAELDPSDPSPSPYVWDAQQNNVNEHASHHRHQSASSWSVPGSLPSSSFASAYDAYHDEFASASDEYYQPSSQASNSSSHAAHISNNNHGSSFAGSSSLASAVGSFSYAHLSSSSHSHSHSPSPSSIPSVHHSHFSQPPDPRPKFEPASWNGQRITGRLYRIDASPEPQLSPGLSTSPLTPISPSDHNFPSIITSTNSRPNVNPKASSSSSSTRVKQEPDEPEHTDGFVFEMSSGPLFPGSGSSRGDSGGGGGLGKGRMSGENGHLVPHYSPMSVVPLRATQASADMKKMMSAFRLDPFTMHNGPNSRAAKKANKLSSASASGGLGASGKGKKRKRSDLLDDIEEENDDLEGLGKNWLGEDIGPLIGDVMLIEFEVGLVEPLLDPSLCTSPDASYDWFRDSFAGDHGGDGAFGYGSICGNERGSKGLGPGESSMMSFLNVVALSPRDYSLASAHQALVGRHLVAGDSVPAEVLNIPLSSNDAHDPNTAPTSSLTATLATSMQPNSLLYAFDRPEEQDVNMSPDTISNAQTSSLSSLSYSYASPEMAFDVPMASSLPGLSSSESTTDESSASDLSVLSSSTPSGDSMGCNTYNTGAAAYTTSTHAYDAYNSLNSIKQPSLLSNHYTSGPGSSQHPHYNSNSSGGFGLDDMLTDTITSSSLEEHRSAPNTNMNGVGMNGAGMNGYESLMTPVQSLQWHMQSRPAVEMGREYHRNGDFSTMSTVGVNGNLNGNGGSGLGGGQEKSSGLRSRYRSNTHPNPKREDDYMQFRFRSPSPPPSHQHNHARNSIESPLRSPTPPSSRSPRVRPKSLVDHIRQSTFHPTKRVTSPTDRGGGGGGGVGGGESHLSERHHPYRDTRPPSTRTNSASSTRSSFSDSKSFPTNHSNRGQGQQHMGTRPSSSSTSTTSPPPPPSRSSSSPDHSLPLTLRHRRQLSGTDTSGYPFNIGLSLPPVQASSSTPSSSIASLSTMMGESNLSLGGMSAAAAAMGVGVSMGMGSGGNGWLGTVVGTGI